MTEAEKFEQRLPEHLRWENLQNMPAHQRLCYDQARQTAYITYQNERQEWRDRYLGWRPALKKKYRDK